MQISRKKFSNFLQATDTANMFFVGYQDATEGKQNIQMSFNDLAQGVLKVIKKDPDWGTGGKPSDAPESDNPNVNPVGVEAQEAYYFDVSVSAFDDFNDIAPAYVWIVDENGNERPKRSSDDVPQYANSDSTIIENNDKKVFIEINGGGSYFSENVFITKPVVGSVTNIVVDNTGRNRKEGENPTDWENDRIPVQDFILNYGVAGNFSEILCVPVWHRGVVQILHTTKCDLILTQSVSEVPNREYIADVVLDEPDENDGTGQGDIYGKDGNKVYIDMKNEAGFIEVDVGKENTEEYTFIFDNTEIGSMSYLIVDNQTNPTDKIVKVNYGKTYAKEINGKNEIIQENICDVYPYEKAIIQIFHSLSMDIVVSVSKL